METTFSDVIEYILTKTTSAENRQVFEAYRDREKSLRSIKASLNASTLTKGDTVEIGDIKPKYLVGLVGTIAGKYPGGQRPAFNVELTGPDADTYRWKSKRQGFGIEPVTPGSPVTVSGIPASCLTKVETDA